MAQTPNLINRHIGARLQTLRLKLGLSQTDVANILGVSYQQQQKYENGMVRLSAASLFILARGLHVSIAYFFEGLSQPQPTSGFAEGETAAYGDERSVPSDAERLDRAFARLRSKAERAQAIALVELVANKFDDDKGKQDEE